MTPAPSLPPSRHKHEFAKRFLGSLGPTRLMTIAEAEAERESKRLRNRIARLFGAP